MRTPPRTSSLLAALYRRGATESQTIFSLKILRDWSRLEVKAAATDNYRNRWRAEYDASTMAIKELAE